MRNIVKMFLLIIGDVFVILLKNKFFKLYILGININI